MTTEVAAEMILAGHFRGRQGAPGYRQHRLGARAMSKTSDYYWNVSDAYAPIAAGAEGTFSTASNIQKSDGYGGTNWSFSSGPLNIHVHFQGASRRVSIVRIKTYDGGTYDENIIKLCPGVSKGGNLKTLAYLCRGYPNHAAMLLKLHQAMPPGR